MMECPACGADNSVEHRFCSECGSSLSVACPECGAENPPSHRFCPICGTGLAVAQPKATPAARRAVTTIEAQRRFVTVLFADLVGFTPYSESRDPEEVRNLLTRYFDRSREIVDRFAGEIDKFIGDAVMP